MRMMHRGGRLTNFSTFWFAVDVHGEAGAVGGEITVCVDRAERCGGRVAPSGAPGVVNARRPGQAGSVKEVHVGDDSVRGARRADRRAYDVGPEPVGRPVL